MKKMIWFCLLGSGLMLNLNAVFAGDYLVIPAKGQQITSWDKIISGASRFQLVLNDAAVLDRETGLVWEKVPCHNLFYPDICKQTWSEAIAYCYDKEVGSRKGWRLPTIEEKASLVDTSRTGLKLPIGHPFQQVYLSDYWSSTTYNLVNNYLALTMNFQTGSVFQTNKEAKKLYVWCVRGGYGHDANY